MGDRTENESPIREDEEECLYPHIGFIAPKPGPLKLFLAFRVMISRSAYITCPNKSFEMVLTFCNAVCSIVFC